MIGVDVDGNGLREQRGVVPHLVRCYLPHLPFRPGSIDLAVFYFTLHEVDPSLHLDVLFSTRRVARKVMVVEPSPEGCEAYRLYARIWREAMHSIGRFEDYKPESYWRGLVERSDFEVITSKRVSWRAPIPPSVLEDMVRSTIEEWRRLSVDDRYIREMKDFLEYARSHGMVWSDNIVVVGVAKR